MSAGKNEGRPVPKQPASQKHLQETARLLNCERDESCAKVDSPRDIAALIRREAHALRKPGEIRWAGMAPVAAMLRGSREHRRAAERALRRGRK